MKRAGLVLVLTVASTMAASGRQPKVDDVVLRLGDYIVRYESQFATVVAEETYRQTLEEQGAAAASARPGGVGPPLRTRRTLRSDYALTRPADRNAWVGFRDTFEVDGKPVRDRDARLQELLSRGAYGQAARIANDNARFNLAAEVLTRNINVPTFALELLHPRNRDRFRCQRRSDEVLEGHQRWTLECLERERPTLVRTPSGRDNRTRAFVVLDPTTGEAWRTTLSWKEVLGTSQVIYGKVADIDLLVPIRMSERFQRGSSVVVGEATYANYRRFETSGRLISP